MIKDDQLYLIHISDCIEKIGTYTTQGKESFLKDSMIQDAVIRNFEIIGEAVKSLSEEFKKNHLEIEWRKVAGFRDVLIHDYMGVDMNEVWGIIEGPLPELKAKLQALLKPMDKIDPAD